MNSSSKLRTALYDFYRFRGEFDKQAPITMAESVFTLVDHAVDAIDELEMRIERLEAK